MISRTINLTFLVALMSAAYLAAQAKGKHLFILSGQPSIPRFIEKASFLPAVEIEFGKEQVISPAVVLGYHHLNPKDVAKHQGKKEKLVRDAYLARGWNDKLFYRDVPLGGHEYNIYHLNAMIAFWDKFCKSDQR